MSKKNKNESLVAGIKSDEICENGTDFTDRAHELKFLTKDIPDKEKGNLLSELYNANKELAFQIREKEKNVSELIAANKEIHIQAEKLILANKELAFQIREKEKREEELVIANKELEAFSYSVSHDLRAPLRHINGFVDLLLKRYYDPLPEKAKHYLDNISDASNQMGKLIDHLLQFSRIGRQEQVIGKVDMNIIVQEVVKRIKQDTVNRIIDWHIATLPEVNGDHAMLTLVWTNLLSNAVKFTGTREKAIISIGVLDADDEYAFSVQDNGVGFDMQYAQKLFGVFQRLHPTSEFEGTGIGLANVQRIILRHRGRIWAKAELDKGAIFNFSIPKL